MLAVEWIANGAQSELTSLTSLWLPLVCSLFLTHQLPIHYFICCHSRLRCWFLLFNVFPNMGPHNQPQSVFPPAFSPQTVIRNMSFSFHFAATGTPGLLVRISECVTEEKYITYFPTTTSAYPVTRSTHEPLMKLCTYYRYIDAPRANNSHRMIFLSYTNKPSNTGATRKHAQVATQFVFAP